MQQYNYAAITLFYFRRQGEHEQTLGLCKPDLLRRGEVEQPLIEDSSDFGTPLTCS